MPAESTRPPFVDGAIDPVHLEALMTSIFQRALGGDFDRLHPQLQRRFGFASADGIACVGTGTMDRVWHGRGFTRPFLWLGAKRHILLPGRGSDIPFTIENYPYRDSLGRETVTFVRTFAFDQVRRWDAIMIYSPKRGSIVDTWALTRV
jgi:hypothetical protein